MEGALFVPKGHLPLGYAVIRLAETLKPETSLVPRNDLMPPWNALDEARAQLRQALGDGDLIAVWLSASDGSLTRIKTEWWRTDGGHAVLRSLGRLDDGHVLLREGDFTRWLAGGASPVAAESGAPPLPADDPAPTVGALPPSDDPDADQDADEPPPAEYVPVPVRVCEQTDPAPPPAGKKSPRSPRRHRTKQQKLEDAFDALQAGGENIQSPASVKAARGG